MILESKQKHTEQICPAKYKDILGNILTIFVTVWYLSF